jgi:nucleoid-associated protein YgaU
VSQFLTWRVRPGAPSVTAAPDTDVVLGCAWVAWALVGYLAVAVAATAAGHLTRLVGVAHNPVRRLAPAKLRRLVDMAVTLSVAAAIAGTSGVAVAGAATVRDAGNRGPLPATATALDWPGLAAPAPSVRPSRHTHASAAPTARPTPRPQPTPRHHPARAGSGHPEPAPTSPPARTGATDVVVGDGDSLWSIAARHLGPNASAAATAIAWHQWYAANRQVVGDDPDLIYPGQRLRQPAQLASAATGSTR